MSKHFLNNYDGQTVQQLIAMQDSHRIDSLVVAVEQALGSKAEAVLSEPERVILAVEALEREVNNGGYHQFFFNSSREFTDFIVRALRLIGCRNCAAITADAIAVLELEGYDNFTIHNTVAFLPDEKCAQLGECDSRYFANEEPIADALFAYIIEHQHEIQIPHIA